MNWESLAYKVFRPKRLDRIILKPNVARGKKRDVRTAILHTPTLRGWGDEQEGVKKTETQQPQQ